MSSNDMVCMEVAKVMLDCEVFPDGDSDLSLTDLHDALRQDIAKVLQEYWACDIEVNTVDVKRHGFEKVYIDALVKAADDTIGYEINQWLHMLYKEEANEHR